jgi:hypothetical protein
MFSQQVGREMRPTSRGSCVGGSNAVYAPSIYETREREMRASRDTIRNTTPQRPRTAHGSFATPGACSFPHYTNRQVTAPTSSPHDSYRAGGIRFRSHALCALSFVWLPVHGVSSRQ